MISNTATVTLPKTDIDRLELTIKEQSKLIGKLKGKHVMVRTSSSSVGYNYYFNGHYDDTYTLEELAKLLNKDLLESIERLTILNERLNRKCSAQEEVQSIKSEEPTPWWKRFCR